MAIHILQIWGKYFFQDKDEGLGSSYERVILNKKLEMSLNSVYYWFAKTKMY